ncbi:MAG: catechol 2,3-dioxygenase-like lactoylglutathione lyase family enzyme [Arenicella sp.]|jgi:catechol 2,3-dioxygenase-like lactoylglutathione lyase family enzyme
MKKVTKLLSLAAALYFCGQVSAIEVDNTADIEDTSTSIMGINHIGLSVKNLDETLAFYKEATDFKLVRRAKVSNNEGADALYAHDGVAYEIAVLKAPNILFELIEFKHNEHASRQRTPVTESGMTHTCFQSPSTDSGWDKFIKAGASPLSRGAQPIDLGGYGVTYGYAYDPEGNMMELEQLDLEILNRVQKDKTWEEFSEAMWMTQVALVTHDIERLMKYYESVLGFQPFRVADISGKPKFDEIVNIDDVKMLGGWFKMDQASKMMEFWQFVNPVTAEFKSQRDATTMGYSFSLEVGDIQKEYQRLTGLGVDFISKPVKLGGFWQVYARDPDSNIFSLRQAVDVDSEYSVQKMDISKLD